MRRSHANSPVSPSIYGKRPNAGKSMEELC
jgi:hypothetical protein